MVNKEIYKLMFKTETRFAALAVALSNTLESEKTDAEKLEWLEMVRDAAMEAGAEVSK
jgi:hypothetical protein